MKHITFFRIGCLWLVLPGLGGFLHGAAIVRLNNYDANVPIKLLWLQTPPTNLFFEVLGGPVAGPFLPVVPFGATNSIIWGAGTGAEPGFFGAGIGIVPGVEDGALAVIILRAWVGGPASTYDSAEVKGLVRWVQETGVWNQDAVPPEIPEGPSLQIPGSGVLLLAPFLPDGPGYYRLDAQAFGPGRLALDPAPFYASYPAGTQVTLTAVAQAGFVLKAWGGDAMGTNAELTVVMDGDKEVSAEFSRSWRLVVAATEGGTVTVNPDRQWLWDGETIEITAKRSPGYFFLNWTGSAAWPPEMNLTLQISQDTVIQANFQSLVPKIVAQPGSRSIWEGGSLAFRISVQGPDLHYLWHHNQTPIPEATSSILSLAKVSPTQAGGYFCVVSNAYGSATSKVASLSVAKAYIHPRSWSGKMGSPAQFSVVYPANHFTHYQWLRNGVPIPGATQSMLGIKSAQLPDAGTYQAILDNEKLEVVIQSEATMLAVEEILYIHKIRYFQSFVEISFQATPGDTYVVEAASDWITWREAGAVVADQNPMTIHLACDCVNGVRWFYRIKAR